MAFDERTAVISYAVRGSVIGKYLGQLGLMVALLCLPPLLVSLIYAEYAFTTRFVGLIALLLVVGLPLARRPATPHLQRNEALSVTALAFVLTPLLMSYPLMAAHLDLEDALFEAVSGITTTGLSVLSGMHAHPKTLLFTRAWLQWFGGLGILVLWVALLMGHHTATRRLIEPIVSSADLISTTRTYARRMLGLYLALSALALAFIWPGVKDGFSALTLMLSAVSTGGFAPFDHNLARYGLHPVAFVILGVSLASAVALPTYYSAWRSGWRNLPKDLEVRALLLLTLLFAILLGLSLHIGSALPWRDAIGQGLLLAMSAQSTTGFSGIDLGQLDDLSKLLMIPSMLIGGSLGSTAGGFKLLRLLVMLRLLQMVLREAGAPPHAVIEPWLAGRRLKSRELQWALLVFASFVGVVVFSWGAFVAFGYGPLDSLFEVVSATATVGLSTGISSHALPPLLKGVLCLDMLAGRVEVIALLVLLFPPTWFGKRTQSP